jgi:hypothetical protein
VAEVEVRCGRMEMGRRVVEGRMIDVLVER